MSFLHEKGPSYPVHLRTSMLSTSLLLTRKAVSGKQMSLWKCISRVMNSLLFMIIHTAGRIKCNYSGVLFICLLFLYYALSSFISRMICKGKSNWCAIIFSSLVCRAKINVLGNKSFGQLYAWSEIRILPI